MQPLADSSAGGFVDPKELYWWIMPTYAYTSLDEDDDRLSHKKFHELADTQAQIRGYRNSSFRIAFYYLFNLLTLGIPYLIGHWFCEWRIFFKCVPSSLRSANVILIHDDDDNFHACRVIHEPIAFLPDEFCQDGNDIDSRSTAKSHLFSPFHTKPIFRHFTFRHEKFIWDDRQRIFRKLDGLEGYTCAQIIDNFQGLSHSKRLQMKTIYGSNVIDVQVKSIGKLLISEVLNPFYIFQIFSVTLWSFDNYYYYATCVVLISIISIIISLRETRRQMRMLRDMAAGDGDFLVSVKRCDGEEEEICSRDLVPGDVLMIPPEGFIMPCDAVVVHGTCIVNESMLTGESIPVRKSAMPPGPDIYDTESLKRHTVFAGTHVIQTRFYAGHKASCVVVRTGFNTLKGSLIRSIMFPKEVGLAFYKDAMKFVIILFGIAFIGMGYAVSLYLKRQASWHTIVVRVLDIVTIVVPPALPAAMTVGSVYAQSRLKDKKIFCISPQKINYCGKLKLICFDKTGTLTEDGLDLWCVVPCEEQADGSFQFQEALSEPSNLPTSSPLLRGMATCHSLTFINGNLVGDPLDMKMFDGTGWELEEPMNDQQGDTRRFDLLTPTVVKKDDVEIGIIREFEFTPQLQRMCVVVKPLDSRHMMLFCKGAPEKVRPLCKNVPEDYDLMLDSFTVKGYRVLTLAYKPIEGLPWHQLQRVQREEIENDMIFAGFLVMQNSLKPATNPVIAELRAGDIRGVMVTGDNMLTALSVARECGMIPGCDKVVIVNADEDGKLEFTLAAHHYEKESTVMEDESESRSRTGSHVTASVETVVAFGSDATTVEEPAFYDKSIRRRSSVMSDDDVRIDIERLVEITPDTLAETLVMLGNNYHFVLTGRTWNLLLQHVPKDILNKILAKGTVYARMSPEYKRQLVEYLQDIGYIVGMCGDGANDCAALKMAHVGISLSEAEASVAAPFTSKIPDISCVPHVIREGRCALVTSFGMFKYMALYSMVQFTTVLLLYMYENNLSDKHFLFIDLGITTTIALVMGRTEPYHKIVPKRPMGSLISFQNLVSILSQILLACSVQVFAIVYLHMQPWYKPVTLMHGDDLVVLSWETTTLFSVSSFQYLILGLVFSKGPPYRKPFYTNGLMMASYLVLTLVTLFLTVSPLEFLWSFFNLMPVTSETASYRAHLLIFPLVNLVLALGFETIVSSTAIFHKILERIGYKLKTKYQYQEILNELEADPSWPPVKSA